MIFRDRRDAGKKLARRLVKYKGQDVIVLGVPRGGVVVADEVAAALGAKMDIVIARKIGAPQNEELAIGAVAADGTILTDEPLLGILGVPDFYIQREATKERREIERRLREYRGSRPAADLDHRIVIVVDDGVATGMTMKAVLRAITPQNPRKLVLALPVAPTESATELRSFVDELVILDTPEPFYSVGQWYATFDQSTDQEVIAILRSH